MSRLTLFDLDNTLLCGDSDFEWGLFLATKGVHDREAYEAHNLAFYDAYKSGTLDIDVFLQFQLGPLARHPRALLERWREQYLRQHIHDLIRPAAKQLVWEELARSERVAIVTATNRFITEPIARLFGIEHLVATEPEILDNGEFSGKTRGIPCFREGKISCVEAWLIQHGLEWGDFTQTVFYSDSHNDLPLLSRVTDPIATNPDQLLRAHAQRLGWPILDLYA